MAGENEDRKEEKRGFAGLSSLVSDLDRLGKKTSGDKVDYGRPLGGPSDPVRVEGDPVAVGGPVPNARGARHNATAETQRNAPTQRSPHASSQEPHRSTSVKWAIGIAIFLGAIWLLTLVEETTSPPPSPGTTSSSPIRNPPPVQSTSAARPTTAQPTVPSIPSRPEETRPPVGQDNVLSIAQIRYCLAEEIRMEGAESALDNRVSRDVRRFNELVTDYNSRCGRFRYREGTLERARREIEPNRRQIEAEGRRRFLSDSSLGTLPMPAPARPAQGASATTPTIAATPSRPSSDATVRAIQQRLNELGYDAGSVDGLMGPRTRAAIIAFQKDIGVTETGTADQALLTRLQQITARPESNAAITGTASQTRSTGTGSAAAPALPSRGERDGHPDLSRATTWERDRIEGACRFEREHRGPGDYYNCLRRERDKVR